MKQSMVWLLAALMSLVAFEAAAKTIVIKSVNMRAGPDIDYPVVAKLKRNAPVEVYGCVERWSWCDIRSGRHRGWVRADFIDTWYKNRRMNFVEAAPIIHIPVVQYRIEYWDANYRDRRFYRDRDRYMNHSYRGYSRDDSRDWSKHDPRQHHDRRD